jgi:hypothetical protein
MQLSGFAWALAKQFSNRLIERGEVPLRNDEMTRCQPCGQAWHERTLAAGIALSQKIGDLFQAAKEVGAVPNEVARQFLYERRLWEELRTYDEIFKRKREAARSAPQGRGRREKL